MAKDNFTFKQSHEEIFDLFYKDVKFGSIGFFPDKSACLSMFGLLMHVKNLKDGLQTAKRLYWPLIEAKQRKNAFDAKFHYEAKTRKCVKP